MSGAATHPSYCRSCPNSCPTLVEVGDGRVISVRGDPDNEVFRGYSCVKGRAAPSMHNHPDRLLRSQKRQADGTFEDVPVEQAMDEIADRLSQVLARHGPRSIAAYIGTAAVGNPIVEPFLSGFMHAIGSRRIFTPNTIDKPGRQLALAMHGRWMAPLQGYHDPQVALLVGANPYASYYGAACGNPGAWLSEQLRRGMQLLVVDPRRSDVAKRATLHLQPVPGEDAAILACLAHVILEEGLFDHEFVEDNARGLDRLRPTVQPFTPGMVAARAGVDADDLVRIARILASTRRGYIACGVGPGFAASSTLVEYLTLVLETLCGHWMRAGETVARDVTLMPPQRYTAQAQDPRPAHGFGEQFRVAGLTETVAGMPTGILADEILLEGEGQVRALLSVGGNPVSAWPDQLRVIDAMRSLDLLVQFDPWMSATARLAHYVVAPTMQYETVSATLGTDVVISLPTYYGPAVSHAQYTPRIVDPPAGADVIAEWEFLYGVAQRMGLSLSVRPMRIGDDGALTRIAIDMTVQPSADDVLEMLTERSRVPLAEVKRHRHGATFPEPRQVVAPKVSGWTGRFDLANEEMMADLDAVAAAAPTASGTFPFRLVGHRIQRAMNSSFLAPVATTGPANNPLEMHPADMSALGLVDGQVVRISSPRASINGIVRPQPALRPGVVSMTQGFGGLGPDDDERFAQVGSPTGRLLDARDVADRYVGMPRIGNIPVAVAPSPQRPTER